MSARALPPMPKRPMAADLPVTWLNAAWWQALDPDALAVYISALMWSMSQGSDGIVPLTALQRVTPLWREDARFPAAVAALVAQGRGYVENDCLILDDWEGKQSQTLMERIIRRRTTSAKSSKAHRQSHAEDSSDERGDESRDESPKGSDRTVGDVTTSHTTGEPSPLAVKSTAAWEDLYR